MDTTQHVGRVFFYAFTNYHGACSCGWLSKYVTTQKEAATLLGQHILSFQEDDLVDNNR